MLCKKVFSEISQYVWCNTCGGVPFWWGYWPTAYIFIKKVIMEDVVSCQFFGNFSNTLFIEHLRITVLLIDTSTNDLLPEFIRGIHISFSWAWQIS